MSTHVSLAAIGSKVTALIRAPQSVVTDAVGVATYTFSPNLSAPEQTALTDLETQARSLFDPLTLGPGWWTIGHVLTATDRKTLALAAPVPGTQGPQGIQGLPGTNGTNGAAGSQGIQGIQGPAGNTGSQGIQGVPGTNWVPVHTVLANDTLALALATNTSVRLTVTAARTVTTTVPAAGMTRRVLILTASASSFVITFGTGFKTTGTLATGTTTARVFVLSFISDGTNLYEMARTVAMVA